MDTTDAFSQLAMCCGFGNRRREFKEAQNYFYGRSSAFLNTRPASAFVNPYSNNPLAIPQAQPYFLVTQPVILATNQVPHQHHQNSTNTLTLVQQAHQHPVAGNAANISTVSILGTTTGELQHSGLQSNMLSSQYAIYSSPSHILSGSSYATMPLQSSTINRDNIYGQVMNTSRDLIRKQSSQGLGKPMLMSNNTTQSLIPLHQQQDRPHSTTLQIRPSHNNLHQVGSVGLSSEVFRQLEKVERQVDISEELELVERMGVVIARALDPYSLVPHFTMDTLTRYHERFIFNSDSVIRFIEIIKKPGQTLGLYIRSVQFEDTKFGRPSRAGLVVTKIDVDSPIYNNQVLHVGDEILSVNLVDIEGMNLDDVVVVMSIPKRLVLALRVPRERMLEDGALMRLQQQHQYHHQQFAKQSSLTSGLYDGVSGTKLSSNNQLVTGSLFGLEETNQNSVHQLSGSQEETSANNNTSNSITRIPEHTSSYFSSSIDAINRELKELRRQRMALSNNEQSLNGSSSGIVTAEYRENLL